MVNLNDLSPAADFGPDGPTPTDDCWKDQAHHKDAVVDVFFDGLPARLCERLGDAYFVAGCMAWMTNRQVLAKLATVPGGCQVVVQKEDFMRPGKVKNAELRAMYSALRCPDRANLPTSRLAPYGPGDLSFCGDPTCEPVRCMGIAHRQGENGPRMHHKFFVMFDHELEPFAVWTGSFNATENSARSRENAVYIRSKTVASLYAAEWIRTLALSESLDWTSSYVAPDWRFGS